MIGIWGEHAQAFLLVFSVIVTVVFALPISLAPLTWGRIFLWKIPDETDLLLYFGRGAGFFLLTLLVFTFRAGITGEGLVLMFEFLTILFALMIVLHVYGAVRRIQPITETVEIGIYCVVLLLILMFFPVA
ncbi:MAG: hypothetical protein PVG42_04960 [Lysobacterales bacterium]|jgi:hypothetical protein